MKTETATVLLDQPLKRGEKTIDAIEVRKPNTGALRGTKLADVLQGDTNSMFALLPRITTPPLTPADLEAMDVADFTKCVKLVVGFLQQQGPNTESPSE